MSGLIRLLSNVPVGRRLVALLGVPVVAAGFALGGCGKDDKKASGVATATSSPGGAVSGDALVEIVNFEFKPQKVSVKSGGKVTWTNGDGAIHAIKDTSSLATPASKDLGKGDTFSITYAMPGSYSYICGIHNYMTGTVDVVG